MSNPSGQQADFFGTKVSIPGINVNQAGDNQLILKDDYNSRVYYNANGVPSVLLGRRSSITPAQYGLFVSKPGIDVTQATDSQLIFNSSNDVFKIVKSGTGILPGANVNASSTANTGLVIAHNLGYVPIVQVYGEFGIGVLVPNSSGGYDLVVTNSYTALPVSSTNMYLMSLPTNGASQYFYHTVDSTNIYIAGVFTASSTGGATFPSTPIKYYILQETAN